MNVKAKGKVHLSMENETHRAKCGWYITKGSSLVFKCNYLKHGELCKRCFKTDKSCIDDDETIEQYDDTS